MYAGAQFFLPFQFDPEPQPMEWSLTYSGWVFPLLLNLPGNTHPYMPKVFLLE